MVFRATAGGAPGWSCIAAVVRPLLLRVRVVRGDPCELPPPVGVFVEVIVPCPLSALEKGVDWSAASLEVVLASAVGLLALSRVVLLPRQFAGLIFPCGVVRGP